MGFAEDIIKLRQRVQDAARKGVVSPDGKDILEAALIQVMNEAERNRQNCLVNAENLRKQAATFEGQAGAFASVTSIVYNVINGYVMIAEKDEAERAAEAAEKAEREALESSEVVESTGEEATEVVEKKTRKKKS